MKAPVDDEERVGGGKCAQVSPEIPKMEGDPAIVKKEGVSAELEDLVRKAAEPCPVDAMFLDE